METYIWDPEDEPTEDPSQTDAMASTEELLLRPEEDELEITAAFLHVRVRVCVCAHACACVCGDGGQGGGLGCGGEGCACLGVCNVVRMRAKRTL
jgi:hypothetical protein